jgi:hypothetical protein
MTITLTREEAQQLLEVFELFLEEAEDVTTLENNLVKMLRTRLAQPEPEQTDKSCLFHYRIQKAQPEPEPVEGYRWEEGRTPPSVTFAAPSQRKWQVLTDEEVMSLLPGAVRLPPGWVDTVRAIEAKLKEKNGG